MEQRLRSKQGIRVKPLLATPNPFEELEYVKRSTVITEPDGTVVFEMQDIEVPTSWSQLATDILSSKYCRKAGVNGGAETSAKQVTWRVAHTIRVFGEEKGYFATKDDAQTFENELLHILINQKAAFNSPVWFNCGLYHEYGIKGSSENYAWDFDRGKITTITDAYTRPQCSACFIQSLGDDLSSIFELLKTEARLFKYGSGTGTNFSKLRGEGELLSGGGQSSGLMSFLEVFDKGAGSIKSGGTTRRAAKMVVLNVDHPEIHTFVTWKANEEKKARALISAGYPSDFNGEAYGTVSGQNSNNSVRVTNDFMKAVLSDSTWHTVERTTGKKVKEFRAKELFNTICDACWQCADPGIQFDTTINEWHTCPNADRINASNPCSEFMFLDDSACNLASLNVMKFTDQNGRLDIEAYRHTARLMLIAQEIIVDLSSYPTKKIAENTHDYRPLGLGFANLGTFLMVNGVPYDSDAGRATAAALTAIMCGTAYATSAELARAVDPFPGYKDNKEPFLNVMRKHRDAAYALDVKSCPEDLLNAAREDWDNAVSMGEKHGYRNSQTTVLAPTGTIALLMDCDTTGVEPEFSLVKWKKLAGGGHFKIVNKSISMALHNLGYTEEQTKDIIEYILGHGTLDNAPHISPDQLKELGFTEEQIKEAQDYVAKMKSLDEWTPHVKTKALKDKGLSDAQIQEAAIYVGGAQTIEGAPHVHQDDYAVFDCANKCGGGQRFIQALGHVRMMAATQPFLSGAISKTVNLPHEATVEDIYNCYMEAWKTGVKAIALYRDGCKASQPLQSKTKQEEATINRGKQEHLPQERVGRTYGYRVAGQKVFVRTGEYEDGRLGEIFLDLYKQGATLRSLMNCFAISVSIGLQHGVPLDKYVNKFTFQRFEPMGLTDHKNIRTCTSMVDFVFRLLGKDYLGRTDFLHTPEAPTQADQPKTDKEKPTDALDNQLSGMMGDAPSCPSCGHITVRNGSCYKCLNCGNSIGCS
ncbi:ribonucleoside-diphosphate reductase, adenosylcobalamin-dependent [Candidatus Woesearchaeota archaeon]|nr:ribonucleoside-diphosphate reductase, adenosylcobalamin-dependent [Candidatus Woesearchaeota archaeon]